MGNCFGLRNNGPYLIDPNGEDSYADGDDFSTPAEQPVPTYHPSPGLSVPASQLTEDEQIQIVKRIQMLQYLPSTNYIPSEKTKINECIICMYDLKVGDEVRYLPCLHTYHRACIDEWLMRSFTCPTCLLLLEPDLFFSSANTLTANNAINAIKSIVPTTNVTLLMNDTLGDSNATSITTSTAINTTSNNLLTPTVAEVCSTQSITTSSSKPMLS